MSATVKITVFGNNAFEAVYDCNCEMMKPFRTVLVSMPDFDPNVIYYNLYFIYTYSHIKSSIFDQKFPDRNQT